MHIQTRQIAATLLTVLTTAVFATACSSDSDSPVGPPSGGASYDSLTVDASASWAAVQLGDPATQLSVSDLHSSADWDIAFDVTSVEVNGGASGPGGVIAYCLCENANATDAQVEGMSPANQLATFTNVTAAQIPSDASVWQADSVALAITGWYSYNLDTHVVSAAPDDVWLVRTTSGTAFAKFHVTGIANPTQASAGDVTFEYALQPAAGQPMGDPQSVTVTVPGDGSTVYFNLQTGETTTGSDWDIAFTGYSILVNGGVSGTGGAGAVLIDDAFDAITTTDGVPSTAYEVDGSGGVFVDNKWYRYNLKGDDHQIWPTFNVYLLKRGTTVYKVQIINYYSTSAEPRHITFRYAKLSD